MIFESVRADEEVEVEVEVVFEDVDIEEDLGDGDAEEEEVGGGGVKDRGDMTEMPYVVRTVETVTGHTHHTHAPGADSDSDSDSDSTHCTPHVTSAATFFPQEEEDRSGQVLVFTPVEPDPLNSDIPQNIMRATNGIDFVFLETFISKEDEVFVTFDGTLNSERSENGESEQDDPKSVKSEAEVVGTTEERSTVTEQTKPVKNKEFKVKKKKKEEAPKKKLS